MIKFSPLNNERNLFNKYTNDVAKFIASSVNQEHFMIPTIYTFLREFKGFKEELLKSYEKNYSNLKGYDTLQDFNDFEMVKLYQSAMDEGMVFALNLETNKLGLYTSRERTLDLLGKEYKFNKDKTVEKNLDDIVHCMRLDVTYVGNDETEVEIKNTSRDKITPKTHILIPFNVMHTLERFFEVSFKKGKVLKVLQNKEGVLKERYLTENPAVLASHNEDGRVLASDAWYFTGVGHMYAPVLGAPSNTMGMSRVDLLNVEKVSVVKAEEGLVEVAMGTSESLYAPQIFSWVLKSLIDKDEDRALRFLTVLYNLDSIRSKYPNLQTDTLREFAGKILSAIGSLTEEELEQVKRVFSLVYLDRLDFYNKLFTQYKQVEIPSNLDDLEALMKEGGYKVTLITLGSKLSVVYCTNNNELLRKIYGEDYDTKFESVGNRIRKINKLLENEEGTEEDLRAKYHIDPEVELTPPEIKYEKQDYARVKLLFAPYTENEVVDFYRTLKLERIISIVKIW